jgi:hypothetical protein
MRMNEIYISPDVAFSFGDPIIAPKQPVMQMNEIYISPDTIFSFGDAIRR